MTERYKAVFTTERGEFHQQRALSAAPDDLDVKMLRSPEHDTLASAVANADYLISERVGTINHDLIQAAPRLKLILRLGSLTHDIDVHAAKQAGVIVCTWPDPGVINVAEHLMMQMLALTKNLREVEQVALDARTDWRESRQTNEDTFAYNWSNRVGIGTLWQKTVGILGFGEIGSELARRLVGWGCRVVYNKRRPLPDRIENDLSISYVTLDQLLRESDVVVNLLPYFTETKYFLNEKTIAKMKPGAILVSCGSGGTIDEQAAANAIESRNLAGIAIDSYDWEPIKPDNPLVLLAKVGFNIVLTPHTAAGSHTASAEDKGRAGDYTNIVNHILGKPIQYRVV